MPVSHAVTVVGAGPAGATAARALARAGVTVRLLDRSKFPRQKPCGGAISIRALQRIPHLESVLSRIATHTLSRLYLEGPGGESTVIESDGPAVAMIRRWEFDAQLVQLAVDAGAELVTGADVVQASMDAAGVRLVARDGRRFDAPFVIAADGVHSVVARRLGINPGWPATSVAVDMMEEAPRTALRDIDPSTLWVAYGFDPQRLGVETKEGREGRAPEGYAYIFPKRDHVNVGIGYVMQHFREQVPAHPYELQRRFVEHLRGRGLMEGESSRRHFTPFIIPVGGPLTRPGRGRVILAGDAGGFVNGFTAEGIYYAMVSGDLAARAVVETPAGEWAGAVTRHARACEAEMGRELRESVLIQRTLFADRRRIARIIGGVAAEPVLTRAVLDFAMGRLPYAALRRRLLLRAPFFALRLLAEHLRGRFQPSAEAMGTG
ncbi:MAG: NAD(P)/FAD-dependent oxidoreductase [Vicinamibacterales bacterium]